MYQSHSETSRAAFKNGKGRATLAEKIRLEIQDHGIRGTSAGWIAQRLNIQTGTLSARLIELQRDGFIVKLNRTMDNPSGTKANVYIAAAYADMIPPYDIAKTKAEKKQAALPAQTAQLLSEIESYIEMGMAIHPGSKIHSRIKALLKHV